MNKGLTVEQLYEACKTQMNKGNGNKHILISNDDEGNGFHTLFYLFSDDKENCEYAISMEHDNHKSNEIVVLG